MSNIKIIKKESVYAGFNSITRYLFELSSFDGQTTLNVDKEIFERKDAIGVILYDPRLDSVVMIEQFRPGSFVAGDTAFPLEIVAGLVDKGKPLEETIIRESMEEAGCRVEKIMEAGYFFPEISFSSRRIFLFCARVDASNLEAVGGVKEENEDTKIHLFPLSKLKSALDEGKIINSHSLVATQWLFLNLDKVRAEFAK